MPSSTIADVCPQCGAPLREAGPRITCHYCGSSLVRLGEAKQTAANAWGVHLREITCQDPNLGGMEIFRMLAPADWQFAGGATWRMDNPGAPVLLAFRCFNPSGPEAFEVFPNITCYWTNQPMVLGMFPVGGVYFGNEVRPPMRALQALRELVVPRYRGQAADLQWAQEELLPDLPKMVRAGSPIQADAPTSADGARVRIRYALGENQLEEDIFGVVELTRVALPMLMGMAEHIYWSADYLFSFRAKEGHLEKLSDLFLAILRSFRLNPGWYNRVQQVSQWMIQNQIRHIQNIGQLSRIISQTSNEISDTMMAAYEQRQQTMDHLSERFSQAIRGVDAYYEPSQQQTVELPGGYGHAWSNGLGEYIVTESSDFNPNLFSNQNWEQMQPKD
jgi:hypothetical protein